MTSKKSKQLSPQPSLLRRLWQNSQTKALAYTQGVSAAVLAGLDQLNGFVSDPHFQNLLSNLNVDKKIYIGLAVLGLITWVAHGHSDA